VPLAAALALGLAALLLGGAAGWLLAAPRAKGTAERLAAERERREALDAELAQVRAAKERAERELAAATERGQAGEAFLRSAREQLRDSFEALAAEALRGNREQFFALADRDEEERRRRVEALLAPLAETMRRLEERTGQIERARESAYGELGAQVRSLAEAAGGLQERTSSLVAALRGSRTQGRWGEIALRNVVELAGLSEHVDFEEQTSAPDGKRPDMIVRLPGENCIAVDAKVPFQAYMDAVAATTEEARLAALDRHVAALRSHVRALAARDYAGAVQGDVDLVVLFLPGDALLAAAFERDPELQVEALRSHVLIATPTTLFALLRTVAVYWQHKSLAENAERIAEVAREVYERTVTFGEHFSKVARGLESAVDAYNKASGSFTRRLLPLHRQLEEMRVTEHLPQLLEAPPTVEIAPRDLAERVQAEDDRVGRLF
jgi:DNA recombination protein RmuC